MAEPPASVPPGPWAWGALFSSWRAHRGIPRSAPRRWAVVDVESSGLDAHRDRLLAVAGVAVHLPERADDRPLIRLGDCFERVLQHPAGVDRPVDPQARANILLHGIGVGEQATGESHRAALEALRGWLDGAPVIGFHVAFDETLVQRALAQAGLPRLDQPFIDLEHVAQALHPGRGARSLDEWMQGLGVHCTHRHRAAADALATAEVLLRLWPDLRREAGAGGVRLETLQALARARQWLKRPAG